MAVILERFINEDFDNSGDDIVRLITKPYNKYLKMALDSKGIDLKTISSNRVGEPISNRSPLWKSDLSTAIDNGRVLVMVFPSGYLYVPGATNDAYINSKDKVGTQAWQYNELSKKFVCDIATPYILYFNAKSKKDRYKDPRNLDNGKYAGQYQNPDYDPNSEYSYRRQKWSDNGVVNRHGIKRDKSGYIVRSLADMKAQLYKKCRSGDLDTELFNKFKAVQEEISICVDRFKSLDPMKIVIDYDKDYAHEYNDNADVFMSKYSRVSNRLYDVITSYRRSIGDANSQKLFYNDTDVAANAVRSIDRIKRDIKTVREELDKLESLI